MARAFARSLALPTLRIAARKIAMDKILEAAKAVASARRDLVPLRPLDPDIAPRDEAEGYRIQEAVHAVLAAQVGPLVGYKIGCTSAVMQE